LIALYERAVGYYASLVRINAYHQPGVEAGKKAATAVIQLQLRLVEFLSQKGIKPLTVSEIAAQLQVQGDEEIVFKICEHLAANPSRGMTKTPGSTPLSAAYAIS
jgi:glucose-6-phosphate isomerase